MTAATALPAHDRLNAISPEQAAQQSALVEALNNRLAGGLGLRAAVTDRRAAPAWIALGDFYTAPLLTDGGLPVLTDERGRPDAAAAAVALAAVEPIIAAIELVVGHPLLPTAVVDAPPHEATVLLIEAHADGTTLHRLLLAVGSAVAIEPAGTLPLDPATIVFVAPGWAARIAGPALRRARLDGIGVGDLLLLGIGHPIARFTTPGSRVLGCRLDVQGGMMIVEQVFEGDGEFPAEPLPTDADLTARLADASVPVTVEFDGGGLTLERLAALGTGSVVSIPDATGGTLRVRLRADGRTVANGELVAVGEGYGVLVTDVAGAQAAGA